MIFSMISYLCCMCKIQENVITVGNFHIQSVTLSAKSSLIVDSNVMWEPSFFYSVFVFDESGNVKI